jgi:hypothetical protein
MSNENPLVKDKAIDTLNAVVNSLIYVVDTMPALERTVVQQTASANDDDLLIYMQRSQFAGLGNTIDGIRAAIESSYTQHARELSAKDQLIKQLQQSQAAVTAKPE